VVKEDIEPADDEQVRIPGAPAWAMVGRLE
jgi:hypothetical protein